MAMLRKDIVMKKIMMAMIRKDIENEDEVGEISRADIKDSVDETFKVGKKFNTYLELKDAIKQFETNNGIQLRVVAVVY